MPPPTRQVLIISTLYSWKLLSGNKPYITKNADATVEKRCISDYRMKALYSHVPNSILCTALMGSLVCKGPLPEDKLPQPTYLHTYLPTYSRIR